MRRQMRLRDIGSPAIMTTTSLRQGSPSGDITLTVHMTVDRVAQLETQLENWKVPVAVALLLRDDDADIADDNNSDPNARRLRDLLDANKDRVRYVIHRAPVDALYPVNRMRNLAINITVTEFFVVVDADFIVSRDMHDALRTHARRLDWDAARWGRRLIALVLPAFVVDAKYRRTMSRDAFVSMLDSKRRFVLRLKRGDAAPFQEKAYPAGHFATDNIRWQQAMAPYEVSYRFGYEPFLMMRRPAPRFDERFVGYGQNKVSYAYELAAANYRFIVAHDAYVIHELEESESQKKRKDWTVGWSCWADFTRDIETRYNFRFPEPCWVSERIWPKVHAVWGDTCVSSGRA
eukprot:g1166.t1